jgi:hypothetical protein
MKTEFGDRRPVFVEFDLQDTRRNLPRAARRKRGEAHFLRRFEQTYLAAEAGIALAGREFGVEGFGRADLVWLAWDTGQDSEGFTALALKKRVCLTAVEGKLKDWRKGLMQAARYRHFAHRSLLVLSMETAAAAARFLPTFRRLRVGLWGFEPGSGRLRKWCTPRAREPLNRRAGEKALHLFEVR